MPKYLTLVPAYGRDYRSAREVRQAWSEGKDFRIATLGPDDGRMINREDAEAGLVLNIRYRQHTQVCVIRV